MDNGRNSCLFSEEWRSSRFYAYYPYSKNINPTAINYDASKSMYDLMLAKQ